MKKKLLALVLCAVMILSVFTSLTSCSKNKDEENAEENIASKNDGAKTLTMWIVTENEKTAEDKDGNPCFPTEVQKAMDEVEKAFSKETKRKYKTNIDIIFLTEEEYYDKLEFSIRATADFDDLVEECARMLKYYLGQMKEIYPDRSTSDLTNQFYIDYPEYWPYREEAAKNRQDTSSDVNKEDEYVRNEETGILELKYPDAKENQVDIIYLSGRERLMSYIDNEWIVPLDDDLAGVAASLSKCIAPALLQGIKRDMMTYAIPNNVQIGEYTYMLIDKEMYDSFGYGQQFTSTTTLVDCKSFLNDVANSSQYADVLPIASNFDETMSHFVWYWHLGWQLVDDGLNANAMEYIVGDGKGYSVFGALYGDPAKASRGQISLGFNNLMLDEQYRTILATLQTYKCNGYYGELAEGQRAAISYLKGDYGIKGEAEANKGVYVGEDGREYYVSVVKYPEVTEEELYGNMLAVSASSEHASTSMEIITAINTDPIFRNILQYGVEGKHYDFDEDSGALYRIPVNSDAVTNKGAEPIYYEMDIRKTGNSFVAHPEEGLAPDYWENIKLQNGDAVVNPLLGFDITKHAVEEMSVSMYWQDLDLFENLNGCISKVFEAAKNETEIKILIEQLASGDYLDAESIDLGKFGGSSVTFDLSKYTNPKYEDESGQQASPYTIYFAWMEQNGYVPAV
ncbi:MAG: hypothetical protein E7667_03960 [Ruminococcaceae bacterium]|nr:hypothetical protein [Oscillospiraceae bacterium]